jgi:dimeric dUTPase (all-alpha-NTP-PPase superfamily)
VNSCECTNQFAEYFLEIADLVTWGIVWPILFAMPNTEDLRKAQTILIGVATIACATGKTIKSLAEVMALMDPVSLFFDSPMEKIVNNKKQFTDWFDSIAVFVRDGIVDPVVAIFTDTTQLNKAAVIIRAMSLIAIRLVPLIKNLAEAISLATDAPTFFGVAPMQKIVDNKEKFKGWFISIAEFMKTGIIMPVFNNLGDVRINNEGSGIINLWKWITGF